MIFLPVYLFQNLFVFDTLSTYALFFAILAFSQAPLEPPLISVRPKFNSNQFKFIFIAALLMAGLAIYYFNIRPALANYYAVQAVIKNKTNPAGMTSAFEKAFQYSPANDSELRFILVQTARDQIGRFGVTEENKSLVELAMREMKNSIAANPDNIQNHLILGELYLAISQNSPNSLKLAEEITQTAILKAPRRYQVYSLYGRIKISQGQFSNGIIYFKKAIELNEDFAENHWNLAIAYILSGQNDLAEQALNRALALKFEVFSPQNIEKLLQAYMDSKNLSATIKFLEMLNAKFPDNAEYKQTLDNLLKNYSDN